MSDPVPPPPGGLCSRPAYQRRRRPSAVAVAYQPDEAVPSVGPRSAGLRVGLLYGPAVFGVTSAGVALGDITTDLHISVTSAVWVLSAHAAGLGVATATFGRFCDSWGVRRSLWIGAALLIAGTLMCVSATDLAVLVVGRIVLAAGSGAMTCSALVLTAAGPVAARSTALAEFGTVLAVLSSAATLAGGTASLLSWRLAVVLPALSLLAIPWCLPMTASHPGAGQRIDVAGAGLLAGAAGALLMLVQSCVWVLPTAAKISVLLLLLLCVLLLGRHTARHRDGFIPRQVIGDGTLIGVAIAGAGVYGGLFAAVYCVPRLLVAHHHFTVVQVGVMLLPGAVLGAALSQVAGPLGARLGAGWLAVTTAGLFAAGLAVGGLDTTVALIAAASLGFPAFRAAQLLLISEVAARVPRQLRGSAMGLATLVCFIGGAVGAATCSALWNPLGPAAALGVIAVFPTVSAVAGVVLRVAANRVAGDGAGRDPIRSR